MDKKKIILIEFVVLLFTILISGCIDEQKNRWILISIQADLLHDIGFTGKGIRIGIIDTGVDLRSANFDDDKFVAWKDLINGREEFYDDDGHGTSISALLFSKPDYSGGIEGVCFESEVVVVKAVSNTGESNDSLISDAIEFCMENNVDIILLSLYKNPEKIHVGEKSIKKCKEALNRGIFIVAPAGDDGLNDDGDVFPLSGIDNVISVGSIKKDMYISSFSSRGNQAEEPGKHGRRFDPNKKPEIVAPGEDIESIYKNSFVKISGTSISSAFVGGSISLLLEAYPNLNEYGKEKISIVKEVLAKTAKKIGEENIYSDGDLKHNDRYGYGLIQVYDAYKSLGEMI